MDSDDTGCLSIHGVLSPPEGEARCELSNLGDVNHEKTRPWLNGLDRHCQFSPKNDRSKNDQQKKVAVDDFENSFFVDFFLH